MKRRDGGPAFPVVVGMGRIITCEGASVWDYYLAHAFGAAVESLKADGIGLSAGRIAEEAAEIASCALAEGEKRRRE